MIVKTLILLCLLFNIQAQELDSVEFLQWHLQKSELYTNSKKYIKRLKNRVKRNEIIGLELISAEASDERVESKFGHSLFRFVDNDNDPGNDITISFVADVDGPKASNLAGVVGKYGVYPEVKSLRLFVKQYVKDQSRPLERYIIPASSEMIDSLIVTLDLWWEELLSSRKEIYLESLSNARKEAQLKGRELFGEDGFEIFELKFFDTENQIDMTRSFGIVQKGDLPYLDDTQRDKALYLQAYQRSYDELYLKEDEVFLNLFGELWKIKKNESILSIMNHDINVATKEAISHFGHSEIKLFRIVDRNLQESGFYALTKEHLEKLDILKKVEISLLVKNLRVKSAASEGLGKYTFFSNNCAGAVIKFLKKSNFPHKRTRGIQGRVPVKLHKWMSRSLLVPYPSFVIDGAQKLRNKIARILGFSAKEFLDYRFPEHQWSIISKYISNEDKFLFYDLYASKLPASYIEMVRREITGLEAPDYNQIYNIKLSENKLYTLCTNKECGSEVKNLLKKYWNKKEIKKVKKLIDRTGNNTFIYSGLKSRPEVLNHLKALKYLESDFGE
ncbi:putative exported protein [Halobacteriovorax marinus SJ]|uniref:Exported protein n=1 Tax=Halobacteriovorax marinus (strain ATCC BAA-682 / DSM 15412 / SJ) TaxID=862908 RepID=E1X0S4_HALMS|nr:DUF4105 domain-containing protein [Halobacteriovorax marinus]CBW26412.1 putative exported protein [Halobacteriovorax marinus SJ]